MGVVPRLVGYRELVRFLLIVIASLVFASTAHAQGVLDQAADSLALNPVYVDPDAERAISEGEANELREAIAREKAGPLYIAVLPAEAANEAGGDPGAALREIAMAVGEPGTFAAVIGNSFRAGSVGGVLPQGAPGELARQSLQSAGNDTDAVLADFVRRVGNARAGEGEAGSGGGDGGSGIPGAVLLALLAIPAALFGFSRFRRRKREQAEFEEVRDAARDDVIALGQDIRALDLDMEMPNADPEAKTHYGLAVERYQQAEEALGRAHRPEDLQQVTELVEEGRWAMEAARAEMEGRQAPERRPPCFFDPRHGPSVTDVVWAPPGGEPREVPACAADAVRVQEGNDPAMREVAVNGQMVPYWQAGPAFAPWAGGFFGGGLLPGLFIGSMLGGGFGGFGYPADAQAADAGDMGDFGDFGGGDFGGGDFGGGDFGGGGDF
jgi:hypothetical protein